MDGVSQETYRDTDSALVQHDEASLDDDGVVQRDEEMRFSRYRDTIGEGRFKVVYKGFDERNGLDIAWGIISGEVLGLDGSTMQQLLLETQRNTKLKHKNIIRCFKCWHSGNQINLITELFTSGNLREFIQEHKQLGADALRKFSKQILEGIDYLHSQDPPVIHGDLRCDKIYVNGNEGTVKIGDLGLVTLLARRYAESEPGSAYQALADHTDVVRHSPDYDVYSFGLCMLEMYSQVCHCAAASYSFFINALNWFKALSVQVVTDPQAKHDTSHLVATIQDDWARSLLTLCFSEHRPTAGALLEQFFSPPRPKPSPSRTHTPPMKADGPLPVHSHSHSHLSEHPLATQHGSISGGRPSLRDGSHAHEPGDGSVASGAPNGIAPAPLPELKACELTGEDYRFSVRQSSNARPQSPRSVCIELCMTALDEAHRTPLSQTIEFEHHLDHDTPEDVGQELQDEYKLSDTDRTIVTAIITECLSTVTGYDVLPVSCCRFATVYSLPCTCHPHRGFRVAIRAPHS